MKWTRKTKEFECRDYISADGKFRIRAMDFYDKPRWREHIANGGSYREWWALLDENENILKWSKTVKRLKEYAETI